MTIRDFKITVADKRYSLEVIGAAPFQEGRQP
jgi:hypothetical protein